MDENARTKFHDLYRKSVKVNNYYKSAIERNMRTVARELGISGKIKFSHYFVLCELYHQKSMTLTQLSEAVGVTPPNISNTVNELVNLGLAERNDDPSDRRKSIICSSEMGNRFGELIVPLSAQLGKTLFSDDESEIDRVLDHYDAALARIESEEHSR